MSSGVDPIQKRKDDKARALAEAKAAAEALIAEANKHTVNSLFKLWERLTLCNWKDKGKETRRMFEKDVLPAIGTMPAEDVRKIHITSIINTMLTRGVKRIPKLVVSNLTMMFMFAEEQGIVDAVPTSTIKKSKIGGKDIVRDRTLKEAEIRELASKMPNANLLKTSECAMWIMLSTCCRIGEICQAQWKHLDLEANTWRIPAENSKNGKPHTIYLSDFAVAQFNKLVALKQSDVWIYPNRENTSYVCKKSMAKQVGDRQLSDDRKRMSRRSKHSAALKLEGGKWVPHDLRRTGATTMGDLGINSDVIEKCLNHTEQNKMKRTYQHQTLVPEQKQAWKLLGERLEILTSKDAGNVITIPKKAA